MTFQEDKLSEFFKLFEQQQSEIRNFEGCQHLELWQDIHNPRICFTCSHWEDDQALQAYRESAIFKETWSKTKALFADKPEAWSVMQKAAP